MKKLMIGLCFAIAAVLGFSLQGNSAKAPQLLIENDIRYVIQTDIRDPYEMGKFAQKLVKQEFDVAGHNWRQGEIEVITNAKGIAQLNAQGFEGQRVMEQGLLPDPRYLNPATTAKKLQDLNAAYPHLTRLEQIGSSIQGRPIYALLISNTPKKDDPIGSAKPSIIFDGVHHAREVMTAEVVMDVAEELLTKNATNPAYKNIVENWMVWVVPMLNVDGSNIVHTSSAMWRKNARASNNRVHGVDINRNYNYKWGACYGSSGSTYNDTYRGASAGSEPEARALMGLADMVRPTASISYHSYSELVLYSYGCENQSAAEKEMVARIGKELSLQLPTDRSANEYYTAGTPWEILYAVDGDSMDHIYANYGSLSYTFEINQAFQPNYSLRQPTLEKHRKAWAWFFERMAKNLLTLTTINSKTGKAEALELEIDTIVHKDGESPYRSNASGKFFKVLDPGTYVITAKTADGRRSSKTVEMNGTPQNMTIKIE